jgi:hypothetical protein
MDAVQFSIWKRAIFRKAKEIKYMSGGVVLYAAKSNVQTDAEIAEKGRFRTETNSFIKGIRVLTKVSIMSTIAVGEEATDC